MIDDANNIRKNLLEIWEEVLEEQFDRLIREKEAEMVEEQRKYKLSQFQVRNVKASKEEITCE